MLIVDDSAPAVMHMRNVLTGLGLANVREAADGAQAVARGRRGRLRPHRHRLQHALHGRPRIGRLSEAEPSHCFDVPIIMVTSEEDPAKLEAVHQLGVAAVCNKSFPPDTVRTIIDQSESVRKGSNLEHST